ncbi:MAG: FAD/NAD(P)-binding protein [Bdellovibrionota bacterium]
MNGLLTPIPIRIAAQYDDGEDARHFFFEPVRPGAVPSVSPGQFFLLTVPGAGEAAFTYASLPDGQGRFAALIRKTGNLTRALFEKKTGAVLGMRGPYGKGWPVEAVSGHRVLVVAGGCGLAPLAPVLEALSEKPSQKLVLLYGARSHVSQVLSQERKRWKEKFPILDVFDRPAPGAVRVGFPTEFLEEATHRLGGPPEAVLTCGPESMMAAIARACSAHGLPAERIWLSVERRMHCGVGLCGHCYIASTYACREGPTYRWDEFERLTRRSQCRVVESPVGIHC